MKEKFCGVEVISNYERINLNPARREKYVVEHDSAGQMVVNRYVLLNNLIINYRAIDVDEFKNEYLFKFDYDAKRILKELSKMYGGKRNLMISRSAKKAFEDYQLINNLDTEDTDFQVYSDVDDFLYDHEKKRFRKRSF